MMNTSALGGEILRGHFSIGRALDKRAAIH